jgi:spermidine/putrescine transport system substrate-binding protein
MEISRRSLLIAGGATLAAAAGGYLYLGGSRPTLNLLAWTGYEERDFLAPFEDQNNVNVQVRTYANADQMVSILLASPASFDVVVVDPEYISVLVGRGMLDEIDYGALDLRAYFQYFQDLPLTQINGKRYAVPIRFGVNSLVYNSNDVPAQDVASYSSLFSPEAKGRVGIWDWYLPNMGVLSRALGNQEPYNLSAAKFEQLKSELMRLRPFVRSIHSSLPELVSALADRRVAMAPGVGEFVAAAAAGRGAPIAWTVPREGGIMWVETMTLCSRSQNKALARKFLSWVTTPEAQASLAQRRAYNSNTPNRLAYPLLSPDQRRQLNAATPADTERLIGRLSVRTLPTQQPPQAWQEAWRAFKG